MLVGRLLAARREFAHSFLMSLLSKQASRIHGNILRTNQVTGNIIVSACCLGYYGSKQPSSSGCALGLGAFTAIVPSKTCANYY